jgi:hypothetical protein
MNETVAKFKPECCDFDHTLCTPESKIDQADPNPPTHYLNPWPEPKEAPKSPTPPAA